MGTSSDAARWTNAYQAVTSPQPGSRGSPPRGIGGTTKLPWRNWTSGCCDTGAIDHVARQIESGHGDAAIGQESGDLTGPAPHVEALVPGGVSRKSVQEPAVERLVVELVGQGCGVGVGQTVVLGGDLAIPGRRAVRQHLLPVHRWQRVGGLGLFGAEQMDPAPVALTGLPLQLPDEGRLQRGHFTENLLDALPIGEDQQPLAARQ